MLFVIAGLIEDLCFGFSLLVGGFDGRGEDIGNVNVVNLMRLVYWVKGFEGIKGIEGII